ncbi:MAG: hypothetical protein ACRC9R_08800 [Enterovibrio sp.]
MFVSLEFSQKLLQQVFSEFPDTPFHEVVFRALKNEISEKKKRNGEEEGLSDRECYQLVENMIQFVCTKKALRQNEEKELKVNEIFKMAIKNPPELTATDRKRLGRFFRREARKHKEAALSGEVIVRYERKNSANAVLYVITTKE